jgi:protein-S-isoprenylcysteine O-methyltransferase Ste14
MSLSVLWRILYCVWIVSEICIGIATRTRKSSGNVHDRGTMLLLWIVLFTAITAGIWVSETTGSNLPGGARWLRPASVLVMIFALGLRWTAILTLGKSFSSNVAIHATQNVHKTGLFRWMRHPSYTGLLLCIFAVGLHTRNWISFLIILVPCFAAVLYRIYVEEMALRQHFGQEYIDYSRETKRLIPGIY